MMEYHRFVILGITSGKNAPVNATAANRVNGRIIPIRMSSFRRFKMRRPPLWRRPPCGCGPRLFCGGFCLAGVRLGELAAEALDASCGVDQLLLAGEERVAGGADFEDDVALVRGAGLKVSTAGALDGDGVVLRVNSCFRHDEIYPLADFGSSGRGSLATVRSRHIEGLSRCRAHSYQSVQALFLF